jgi:diguanylate cyclase (GGDEF)-like protein
MPAGPRHADVWVPLDEAATFAGVAAEALRAWSSDGRLPHFTRPGGEPWFRRRDLERIVTAGPERASDDDPPATTVTAEPPETEAGFEARVRRESVEMSELLARSSDVGELLHSVAERLRAVTGATSCDLWMLRDDRLICMVSCDPEGFDPLVVGTDLARDAFPTTWEAVDTHAALVIEGRDDERLTEGERGDLADWGLQACISIPMMAGDRIVGLIDLLDTVPRDFAEYRSFLSVAAAIVAGALEKAMLLELLEQSNEELQRLVDASLEFGTTLDYDAVVAVVAERLRTAAGATFCDIYRLEDGALHGVISTGLGAFNDAFPGRNYRLHDFPTSKRAVDLREPVAVEDIDTCETTSATERSEWRRWGISAGLIMPLVIGGRVVGITSLFYEESHRFGRLDFLRGLNQLAARAIGNADLYREQESLSRQLATVLDSGRVLASSLVAEDVLGTLAQRAAESVGSPECTIWEYEAATDTIVSRSYYARDTRDYDGLGVALHVAEHPSYRVLLDGIVAVEERISDPGLHPESRASMEHWGEKSCLTVPMRFGGEPVGLLVLIETETERHFSDHEVALLTGLAEQGAVALHNASMFRVLEEQNRRLASLLEASRTITSSLVLDEVLERVGRQAADALAVPTCLIYEYDAANDAEIVRTCFERAPTEVYPDIGRSFSLDDYPRDREIMTTGEAVEDHLSDPDLDLATRDSMVRWNEKSALNVPFRFGDEWMGMLVFVEYTYERHFTPQEVELARGLGDQAAVAIHNARVYGELERRQRETELLNEIARKVTSTLNIGEIAAGALSELNTLIPFDGATLVMVDESGAVTTVYDPDGISGFDELRLDEVDSGFLERLSTERAVIVDIATESPLRPDHPVAAGRRSAAVVGLFNDRRLIGALLLGSDREGAFSEGHRDVLRRVGTHLGLALTNAALYDDIRRLHLNNLKSLSSALSAKDYYTLGHAARVAAYSVLLGRELGWSDEMVAQTEEAAYLHDIGKIAISDRVLLKPSRLNEREWELMRQHPSFSADIISALFTAGPVAGVRHHHERYDGTGYPDGLRGDEIPPLAMAMGVVDAYDAMSSWRPYRPAMDYGECLAELDRCRGTQFDPDVVDAFRRVLDRLRELRATAERIAGDAAKHIDVAAHETVLDAGGAESPTYREIAAVLREVRDANPPTRFLTTIAPAGDGTFVIVVDPEEDPAFHSAPGDRVIVDDEIAALFSGETPDVNVVYVDEWGVWVSAPAPMRDANGDLVAIVNADLPAVDSIHVEGLHGNVSETFASLVHSAALRFSRAEVDAITDGLTGVFNHRFLHERLAEEIEASADAGATLTLLFCDLDHFKAYNDQHGHSAGDTALRAVAGVIESSIRHVDVAARYGGEEFAVILVDTDTVDAAPVAERIRDRVARTLLADDGGITVSVGVASYPAHADSALTLIEAADRAMYDAKRRGRDRVVAADGSDLGSAPRRRSTDRD